MLHFVPSLLAAVAAHWVRSGLFRLGEPLYLAFAMEQFGENERATASSLLQMSRDIGGASGPYVSGIVQVRSGFAPLFVFTTMLCVLSLVCLYRFFGLQRETRQITRSQPCRDT